MGVFSRGTTRISGSLSCGAREVRSPCAAAAAAAAAKSLQSCLTLCDPIDVVLKECFVIYRGLCFLGTALEEVAPVTSDKLQREKDLFP